MRVVDQRVPTDGATQHRFAFGENWTRFLTLIDEERIREAERSLREMLALESLSNRTFLDIGSGNGLFSLAAMRLGAKRVHSFDYDPASVGCAYQLKSRYFPCHPGWTLERGDVLDLEYLRGLGQWDVVYSWGVLHHTGNLRAAMENVIPLVRPGGLLYIAIYNDQGLRSRAWRAVKELYNEGPMGRMAVLALGLPSFALGCAVKDLVTGHSPASRYVEYRRKRGMSITTDWIDWLGGYPFEVAKPETVFQFYRDRGFSLARMTTCGGRAGCNEFVFERDR